MIIGSNSSISAALFNQSCHGIIEKSRELKKNK
jgi:hypothetical protein